MIDFPESITVTFIGREVRLERVYQGEHTAIYMGDVTEQVQLEAYGDADGAWSMTCEDKSCAATTTEEAIAKLEKALTPLAEVLAPLVKAKL